MTGNLNPDPRAVWREEEQFERVAAQLLPEARHEVANAVENARRVVACGCSCADCVAIVDRALANLAEWREFLTRKRSA